MQGFPVTIVKQQIECCQFNVKMKHLDFSLSEHYSKIKKKVEKGNEMVEKVSENCSRGDITICSANRNCFNPVDIV